MKIRILNGGHQVVSNIGEILSVETISEGMEHSLIGPLFRKIAMEEIVPHVHAVPDMTPAAYVDLIEERFSNPQIIDTVRRVAFDGSSRHTGFILPVIRDALATGSSVEGLALSQALWARMCEGTREDGSRIEPNDPFWDALQATAVTARSDPAAWLNQRQLYGDLADHQPFADAFSKWLGAIWESGSEKALEIYLNSDSRS